MCRYLAHESSSFTIKDFGNCYIHHDDSMALRYSAIKLYHHPCGGGILWSQIKDSTSSVIECRIWWSLYNHVIWWMNGLVDIIIADNTAGQQNWCFAEIGTHRQTCYTVYLCCVNMISSCFVAKHLGKITLAAMCCLQCLVCCNTFQLMPFTKLWALLA